MKKILIVSAVFPPEPVVSARLSFDLATALTARSKKVTVISPVPTRPYGFVFKETKPATDFEHIQTNSFTSPQSSLISRLKETYSFGQKCYDYICANHADIACVYSNTWPLFAQYYTVKAAKKFNIPVVIHVQDIYPESLSNKLPVGKGVFNALFKPMDRFIFNNAHKVIAISDKTRDYLAKTRNLPNEKITVIQNWQDETDFVNAPNIANSNAPFTFMYLGNIGPVAGCDFLIDAFAKAEIGNARLVIAGSGAVKEALQEQAKKINDKVIEFWDVPEGKVAETQAQADVMLLPMKKGAAASSVPSKLPAYMFSKKAIIASVDEQSDTAAAINNSGTGWVTAPEDQPALSALLEKVAQTSKSDLLEKGEKGFNYSIENYSKASNLNKLLNTVINLSA